MAPSGNQTETEKTNISLKHQTGLEEGRPESNELQESAEGIVGIWQAELLRHSGAERRREQICRAVKRMLKARTVREDE